MPDAKFVAPNTIPPAYAALGATRGFNPPSADESCMVLSAQGGEGKSTFASSIKDAIVLDFDWGAHSVVGGHAVRIEVGMQQTPNGKKMIDQYDHYLNIVKQLTTDGEAGHCPFKRVVIDTADTWVDMLAAHLCEDKGVSYVGEIGAKGAGWNMLYERCKLDLNGFKNAGLPWLALCHVTEKTITVNDKERTVCRASVFPKLYDNLCNLANIVAVMHMKLEYREIEKEIDLKGQKKMVKTGQNELVRRFLVQVESDDLRRAKRRLEGLTGIVDLPVREGWGIFADYYNKQVSVLRELETSLTTK
jgi:hypothetical protein